MTAPELRALADLNLSTEQMKGVLELLAARIETDDKRRTAQAERKRQSRDRIRTVTGKSRDKVEDTEELVLSPPPPSSFSPIPPIITTPTTPISDIHNARDPSKPPVSRGSRLPADFVPLPNILELGRNRGLSEFDLADETEKFRDWANAATGQVSIKRDWQGAFRNWIKRAAEDRKKTNGKNNPNTIKGGFDVIDLALEQARLRQSDLRRGDSEADSEVLPRLRQITP
jgi:hypothetical protein